jgi:uncharacterized protein YprB with RNaseH-like and TPR domain
MMSKLRDKLNNLEKDKIKKRWQKIDAREGLSTRDKLEKLVNLSLKRDRNQKKEETIIPDPDSPEADEKNNPVITREYSYPLDSVYGKFALADWTTVSPRQLAVTFGEEACDDTDIQPMNLLFFDTETTGISGGTGTIPWMLGFAYFDEDALWVKIFILNDLYKEDVFLEEVDRFLESRDFSATVTYNGKSFDFPLMESRYILQRKRFPLLKLPHLDFLFPARVVWKNTYESRRLGNLGEFLLGMSRQDDIDGSQIPATYFNYLRSKSFAAIRKVVEHNALDLVGLAALLLLVLKYQEDTRHTDDEGEILGTAKLYEKYGDLETANRLYEEIKQCGTRQDIISKAVKGLAVIKKKEKLYSEASQLWELLTHIRSDDHLALRELSMHLEHREKNYSRALLYVRSALESVELTENQRSDFEKRLNRLTKKIAALDNEE